MEEFKTIEMPEVPAGYSFENIKREGDKIVMVCKKNPEEGVLMSFEGMGVKALFLKREDADSTAYSHAFIKKEDGTYAYDTNKAIIPELALMLLPHELREANEDEIKLFKGLLADKNLAYDAETHKVYSLYRPLFGDIAVIETSDAKYIYLKSQATNKFGYTGMIKVVCDGLTLHTKQSVINVPFDTVVRRANNDETAMLVEALEERGYIIKDKIVQRKQYEVHLSVSPKTACKVTVYARLAELAEELNEGWIKKENEIGWFIRDSFDTYGNMIFKPASHESVTYPGIVYFKSPDLVQRAIKLIGRDLYAFYK